MKIYEKYDKVYLFEESQIEEVQTRDIASTGTVYSFTKIHVPPTEFKDDAPYLIAIIQLDEANLKITARILGDIQIGSRVQLDYIKKGIYYFSPL